MPRTLLMQLWRKSWLHSLGGLALVWIACARAASLSGDWQHEQSFDVAAPGLVKVSLPLETLDGARAGLEDLRLYDDAGAELPYLLERPAPAGKVSQSVKSFKVSLNPATTVVTLETGMAQPLDGVTLETPANSFIKSAQIEGSADGQRWQTLAQGLPIFRQPGGPSQLRIDVAPGAWRWLRVTVDDQRSPPVPFSGARVHAAAADPVPGELLPSTLIERHENPGETRLTLNLGAANLTVGTIQLETSEPLFTRQVAVAVPQISEDAIREQTLAQGSIYRVAVDGQAVSSNLTVAVESQVRSRQLLLLIGNRDSPPLPVSAVRVVRRPVYVVFLARQGGRHRWLSGNNRCAAPSYDLAGLAANLKSVAVLPAKFSALTPNPDYRPREVLPGLQEEGAALDVTAWTYRKSVKLDRGGAQQIELDLEVLSHAQSGFQDLRLLRKGKQLPYILERTSISRALAPAVTATNDAKDPKRSRWIIALSHPGLPVTRLTCASRTTLFRRDATLSEDVSDERGEKHRRTLGSASWVQTPERPNQEFVLTIDSPPESKTLYLETHNGDNPAIDLNNFRIFYPATRLLFKATSGDEIALYYGNPRAPSPRYDLSLVAGQLLAADRITASLAAEEQLRKPSWGEGRTAGKGGVVFWGILALVVVVLLVIISRLLPKTSQPSG